MSTRASLSVRDTGGDPLCDMPAQYAQIVSKLLWMARCTRPDIVNAVTVLCRYLNAPKKVHWKAVIRVCAYLKGTKEKGIVFSPSRTERLQGWCDADWAGCADSYKSTSGYVFKLAGAPISWRSVKQKTVALSTTEAECLAALDATREAAWLRNLLLELGKGEYLGNDGAVLLHCDNLSTLHLVNNGAYHTRTKHMMLKFRFVRQAVEEGWLTFNPISSHDMVADFMTKPLPRDDFERGRDHLVYYVGQKISNREKG